MHIIKGEKQITNIQAGRLLFSGQLRVVLFFQALKVQGLLASIGYALQVVIVELYVKKVLLQSF